MWDWLRSLGPGWPSERQWVTVGVFVLAGSMLKMAEVHQELWRVELFKTLLTLVIGTGLVNMILAFHFASNKGDEVKAENTGKLADAFATVARGTPPPEPEVRPAKITATIDDMPVEEEAIRTAIADAIENGVLVPEKSVRIWNIDDSYARDDYVVVPPASAEEAPRVYRAVNDVPPGIKVDNMTFWTEI